MREAAVPDSPPAEVRDVADALTEALGNNLTALLWHGSWVRGEQTPESDHDMIVVVKRLDADIEPSMHEVFADRPGWSVYVKTEEELRQYPMTGRIQFHYGLVRLYGDFEPPPLSREGLLEDMRRLAVDIAHEARYRLIHEPKPVPSGLDPAVGRARKSRLARVLYYQAKLAVLAMKARELYRGASYPATRSELRSRLSDPDEVALIDAVARWPQLKPGYEEDFRPLARIIDNFARGLVHELDSEADR